MVTLGYIFLVLLAIAVVGAIVVLLMSIPSINKYRQMSKM